MMVKAKGGKVWHKKDKKEGVLPISGIDKEATWSYSKADGWLYGHGTFCLTSHDKSVVGLFIWMPNSAHEGKRLGREIPAFADLLEVVCMDLKADDEKMHSHLKNAHGIKLLTVPRAEMDKSERRQRIIAEQMTLENRLIYKRRSTTVEPMQAVIKDIFDLEDCPMRRDKSNRWMFAAMGVAMQIAQHQAEKNGTSTWKIKEVVCGL